MSIWRRDAEPFSTPVSIIQHPPREGHAISQSSSLDLPVTGRCTLLAERGKADRTGGYHANAQQWRPREGRRQGIGRDNAHHRADCPADGRPSQDHPLLRRDWPLARAIARVRIATAAIVSPISIACCCSGVSACLVCPFRRRNPCSSARPTHDAATYSGSCSRWLSSGCAQLTRRLPSYTRYGRRSRAISARSRPAHPPTIPPLAIVPICGVSPHPTTPRPRRPAMLKPTVVALSLSDACDACDCPPGECPCGCCGGTGCC